MKGALPAAASLLVCALAGCPTVDLGDDPVDPGVCRPDPAFFRDRIWPEYVKGNGDTAKSCVDAAGCHNASNGRSALRLEVDESDPTTFDRNYQTVVRFLNCSSPDASSFVTKPLDSEDPHGGGDLFDTGSEQYAVFLEWLGGQ